MIPPGRPEEPVREGTLYVVATPIGNVEDLSPRASRVLGAVDRVLCEDTRRTGRLLARLGIDARLESHHEHNERHRVGALLEALRAGERIALVSDAGTPLLSDPGFPLVRAAREAGLEIVTVAGPSAITAALAIAGLPTDRFVFLGYLPRRSSRARALLETVEPLAMTLVVFESPHRIARTLELVHDVLGPRECALCRELTKLHEEVWRAPLDALLERVRRSRPRGELTLVVGSGDRGHEEEPAFRGAALEMVERLESEGVAPEEAARRTREVFG